jgi:endonuclease YncB( thermonuclease family)
MNTRHYLVSLALSLAALALPPSADAALFRRAAKPKNVATVTVARWIDGDSPVDSKGVEYRLHGADAPEVAHNSKEVSQPYGDEAKAFAENLAPAGSKITLRKFSGKGSYGRPVVDIKLPDGTDLATDELNAGVAWADPRYATKVQLAEMGAAKKEKRGLWGADKPPISPQEWRDKKMGAKK